MGDELDDLTAWDYFAGGLAILCVPAVIFCAGVLVGWVIWA